MNCWKISEIIISQKWRWWPLWGSFRTSHFQPPDPCAHFIYTLQKVSPPRSTARAKTSEFRSLLADLGHFLTSDVILKENFCRLASIWLIGLMKLFALGRIDSAVGRKLWLAGKVGKFTEMVVIPLRILSSVGEAWRPPGHPRRLRPRTRRRFFFHDFVVVAVVNVHFALLLLLSLLFLLFWLVFLAVYGDIIVAST